VIRGQIADNIDYFLQQVAKKLRIGCQYIPRVTGKFDSLPVKLKDDKTNRNQYHNHGPDGKNDGDNIFLDEARRSFGKIHLTGDFLVQGHDDNVEQRGPEENGKEGRKKTAYNQKKQEE
jgi:hypothetical protein